MMADLFDPAPGDLPAPAAVAPDVDAGPVRPHRNCYWVVPGALMAGEYPGAAGPEATALRLAAITAAGVRHFIDLTEAHELVPYHPHLPAVSRPLERPVTHERWSIRDADVPHSAAHANRILDRIDALLAVNAVPYLHCWGGIGRTGTIVGCWLVRHGRSGEAALEVIAGHWATVAKRVRHPRSPETPAQRRFVLDWAKHDRLRSARPAA